MFEQITNCITSLTFKFVYFKQNLILYFLDNLWCNKSNPKLFLNMWLMSCIISAVYFIIKFTFKFGQTLNRSFNRFVMLEDVCVAIEENNVFECIRLLERDCSLINKPRDSNGYTPFLIACANGNTQLVKYMLRKGADVAKKSASHESAFYLATFYYIKHPHIKNASCIWELYHAGADINEPNAKGFTPIQLAAMFGHIFLVKWLLMKNATTVVHPHPYFVARSQGHQDTALFIKNWESHQRITDK